MFMEKQMEYYTETGKYRGRFDQALPTMAAYTAFRQAVHKDEALNLKTKRLIALTCGLMAGCTRCVHGQVKDAINAGATRNEILEAVSVAVVMVGRWHFHPDR
jgi:AhpD family alkylhydroperoxidase